MTNNYKIRPFRFFKSINKLLLISGIMATLIIGLLILVFALKGNLEIKSILVIITCAALIFPIGLVILTLVANIVISSRLSKKSIFVNDFSSLEALPNVDILFVDIVDAITDGHLTIKKVIPLKAVATEEYIAQWVSNVLRATNDDNIISRALKEKYDLELSAGVLNELSYNEKNQYFGASFKGGKTIIIGAPDALSINNKAGIIKRCEEELNNGCTVLVIGQGKAVIEGEQYSDELEPIALIVLKDHIRENASETFKLFKKNNIEIKVISSDNALKTSVIAAEAGIENADKYISLEGMSAGEIKKIAAEYTIFARANAGQKRVLMNIFRKQGHKVMMIGDGCNDISALRATDCSITITNDENVIGTDSDIVLTNTVFSDLPKLIDEGRNITNNLAKAASLYAMKTIFAFALTLVFGLITSSKKIIFPFIYNQFLPWDLVISGAAALFLILEKNDEQYSGSFLMNVFKKAIPGSLLLVFSTATMFVLHALQNRVATNLGIYSLDGAVAMSIIAFNVLGIACLYRICVPLNKYRITILSCSGAAIILMITITAIITFVINKTEPVLAIPYLELNSPSLITLIIVVTLLVAIYLFIYRIIEIKEGDNLNNED